MPHIQTLADSEITPEARQILDEIEQAMGRQPNLFRTYAHHVPLLKANWEKLKATMMEGNLPRQVKETIALLVSQDNGCEYCIAAHSGALKKLGVSDTDLETIREGKLEDLDYEDKHIQLVALMRKVNGTPHDVDADDFEKVRRSGANDTEIVEAYGVMETFVAFNRFLDSIGVELG